MEDNLSYKQKWRPPSNNPKHSKIVEWLMRKGIIKNENQANYILLGFALLMVIIAILFPIIML